MLLGAVGTGRVIKWSHSVNKGAVKRIDSRLAEAVAKHGSASSSIAKTGGCGDWDRRYMHPIIAFSHRRFPPFSDIS